MKDSKLIEMFQRLNSKEVNRFEAYVTSPVFNKSEKVIQLFYLIKAGYPSFKSNNINKSHILKKLYPNKRVSEASLRALMSQLSKLLEDFLAFIIYEKDAQQQQLYLLRNLRNRELGNLFDKKFNTFTKNHQKKIQQNPDYFFHQLSLSEVYTQNIISKDSRSLHNGLGQLMNDIDIYYCAMKLKYTSVLLNGRNILNTEQEINLLEEILVFVETAPEIKNIAFINAYYLTCKLLHDRNEQADMTIFDELKILLKEESSTIFQAEVRHLYHALTNYCTQQIKVGNQVFLKELFELYKEMLEQKVLIVDRFISPHHYSNIVTISLKIKEYEWSEQFIEDYRKKVRPTHREDVYNYVRAALFFEQEKYDDAILCLHQMALIDPYYYIVHKMLLIKIYYHAWEKDAMYSAIEAFRIYLMRDKALSENNHLACQNFINILKKLLRIKAGGNKSLSALGDEIRATVFLGERQWLNEKVIELNEAMHNKS